MLESYDATVKLKPIERVRLTELESIIEQGLQTFYDVGKALDEIREQKLYRETDHTFEAYCRNKWSIARRTAYQFIDAAKVMENLAEADNKPTKERQVRPLTKLPPELQAQIWQEALESASNGKPTGAAVQRLVDKYLSSEKENTKRSSSNNGFSELDRLRLENERLKEELDRKDIERERRAAEVAKELERLREENRQLKAELRQRDIDWERRLAFERRKIRAEYEEEINSLKAQVTSLTQQLADMTAKYEAVLARLETIEKGK